MIFLKKTWAFLPTLVHSGHQTLVSHPQVRSPRPCVVPVAVASWDSAGAPLSLLGEAQLSAVDQGEEAFRLLLSTLGAAAATETLKKTPARAAKAGNVRKSQKQVGYQRKLGRNFRVTDSREEMRLESEMNHM